MLVKPFEVW